ncbi:MAG: type IV pilus assembly protein PilM [Desulfobacteraceae bacterium]|jgi:type IV pilus assembly protein PilM|nr:MAG: type IV pilus assembly protein PilM [Desulfobacteraceae bacterium]
MSTPRKYQLVGLDIGSHSVKLVEIEHGKRGRVLKNLGIIGIPHESIVEGNIREMQVVASAIKKLFKGLKVKNKKVATSISGYSVIVKKISIPRKEEGDLEKSIHEEAEQFIPFDINEVNLDFDILTSDDDLLQEDEGSKGDSRMDVILVAAKKSIVEEYMSLLELAGLTPFVLDVDAFALENALEMGQADPFEEGCVALAHVGAEELIINVINRGASIFTRDSNYGGSQINQAIMGSLDVTYEEAERIKLGGLPLGDQEATVREIFASTVRSWVQEIRRALDFVASTYPDLTIDKILVSGGSCRIPGFMEYLADETDLEVSEFNPFKDIIVDEKQFDLKYLKYIGPQAAVAVGLALRSVGDK